MKDDDSLDLGISIGGGPNAASSPAARPMTRQPSARKVVVVPLCVERQFSTLGSTTYKYYIVGPRKIEAAGPFIEDIVGHARGKDFTAQFNWKLVGEKSFDSEIWNQFSADIIPVTTSAGTANPAVHNNRSDYQLNIRFLIGVANGTGTTIEIGNLTAYAAIKFWS